MNKEVEIAIILFSNEGREINFRDFKSGICYLEQDEYTPNFFWGVTGGFEIIIDGYKTVYRGFEFYVSLEAIKFLLHSLYWIDGRTNSFDKDEDFPESVVARFQNNNYIKLSRKETDILSFSYQSTMPQVERARGIRFFKEELFFSNAWYEAAMVGLKEYFDILIPILQNHPEDTKTEILINYLVNDWSCVKR